MNLSLRWLADYVKLDVTPKEFCAAMTMSGSKVEAYEEEKNRLDGIVIGKILSKKPHENADALFVCSVDMGSGEPVQIVTNAKNVQEGDLVPVATPGTVVTEGSESMKIKVAKVRGVESRGMFCGLETLGLTQNDFPYADPKSVFVIKEDCKPGQDAASALGVDDVSVEFEITSNRPDCLSVIGLAREAAATFDVPLTVNTPVFHGSDEDITKTLSVEILNTEKCTRYCAGLVRNVKIGPSPRWMRERLRASGVRPINNLVDITNYVMLEYGQPMHAFDLRFVKDGKIIVRNAKAGEKITTLDGIERELSEENLIIADSEKPIAVAGVMGGEYSGIMDDTVDVVFESAYFEPVQVRRTAKKLGMRTDASARYEKGLDETSMPVTLARALQLVEELGAGEPVGTTIDCNYADPKPNHIPFDPAWINAFLGTEIPAEDMVKYLESLEIKVENGECIAPSFRIDLARPADIAEEVARIFGYNNIPNSVIRGVAKAQLTPEQKLTRTISQTMAGMGCSGILTYSFISPKWFDKIGLPADSRLRRTVTITNPLGEDTSVMQTTTLPGMLEILANNYNKRNPKGWLFEIGKEYIPTEPDKLPEELLRLTVGLYGGDADFFTLKGMIENLLAKLGIPAVRFTRCGEDCAFDEKCAFHPGRSAVVYSGETALGIFGEIHPAVQKTYGIGVRTYVAKLNIPELFAVASDEISYKPLPKFPAMTRDISVVCDEAVAVGELEEAISRAVGKSLESVELFDVYRGEQIENGKKSVSFAIILRNPEETMTTEQADAAMKRVLKALSAMGAELREA
ncbi:MAG: phenylalanine--tRNA ligase subunit beta [Oscillospiraceae bacterium]|nr:phenylalanine--tRNA ligase subunit beta [Oscillospiraceae bacterium]